MAKRIFELARDLGVTSKVVLVKCRAEGLEIKNHMSTVSAGLSATIGEWFSESADATTAVETAEHVDLASARAAAKKQRRRSKKAELELEQSTAETEQADTDATEATESQEAESPTEQATELADDATAEPAIVKDNEPGAAEHGESQLADTTTDAEVEVEVDSAEAIADDAQDADSDLATDDSADVEQATTDEQLIAQDTPSDKIDDADEPVADEEAAAGDVVVPAGPQVVPKPAILRGPKVIRVEKPDYIPARPPRRGPRPRPGATGAAGGRTPRPSAGSPVEMINTPSKERSRGFTGRGTPPGGPGSKKVSRRSPRRKGGRTGDSGEKLKEWRNQDLVERDQRLAAAGTGRGRHRASISDGKMFGYRAPTVKSGKVEIDEPITIKNLASTTGLKAAEFIKKLMGMGILATVNQVIETEQAEAICLEYDIELVVKKALTAEDELEQILTVRSKGDQVHRAPVVTFLGHVDHGKTSLLDAIRKTAVATGEAGGITQHIGAYRHDSGDSHVVFLDTPGHEAFTAMRARGANMTDVVVLVVAADDGVMPQTVEAINHAKAAKVPIVVALNKIDIPNANVTRALGQLAEHGLQTRQWGGDTEVIETSAETGQGIEDLVETLSLEAELLELKADPATLASGYVIESEVDPGRGCVAQLLVLDGMINVGDIVLAGRGYGRVRQMIDDRGKAITTAGPATPVEISGLDEVPEAGDKFFVMENLDSARSVAQDRRDRARAASLATAAPKTLEGLISQIADGQVSEVPLIIKADVQGSIEAIIGSLTKLGTDEVRVNIIHTAVGGITSGDVTLAYASGAVIVGFNVVPNASGRKLAEEKHVDIRQYRVIYDIIDDVRKALEQGLAPEVREEILGRAEIRQVFKVSRFGSVAGCYVQDGLASRNAKVRIIRNEIVIEDGRSLDSLKRFKDDAREVRAGLECGLKIAGYNDIKEGDIIEFYQKVEIARTL